MRKINRWLVLSVLFLLQRLADAALLLGVDNAQVTFNNLTRKTRKSLAK